VAVALLVLRLVLGPVLLVVLAPFSLLALVLWLVPVQGLAIALGLLTTKMGKDQRRSLVGLPCSNHRWMGTICYARNRCNNRRCLQGNDCQLDLAGLVVALVLVLVLVLVLELVGLEPVLVLFAFALVMGTVEQKEMG